MKVCPVFIFGAIVYRNFAKLVTFFNGYALNDIFVNLNAIIMAFKSVAVVDSYGYTVKFTFYNAFNNAVVTSNYASAVKSMALWPV